MSRLLFVVESLAEGGTERSLVELLPGLLAAGHEPEIAVLFARGGLEARARELGVAVTLVGGGWAGWVRGLRRLLAERRPDLVHSMLFRGDLVARLASVGSRAPLLSSLVNTPYEPVRAADPSVPRWKRALVRRVDAWTGRRLCDHFHAVSETVKRSAVERLGLPAERVTVVPRGRDRGRLGEPGEERRRRARARLGLAADRAVVLAVGRLDFQKGYRHLLAAYPRLEGTAGGPPLLLIAGRPGGAAGEIARLLDGLAPGDRVRLLGHRDDVPELLAAADVFVSPTRFEGMPGAILEAMAMELPVVASDLPAVREVVAAGESGLLVPPGDEAAIAAAIARLLGDRPLAARLGRHGRRVFDRDFTLERSLAGHLALYDRLLAGRGTAR